MISAGKKYGFVFFLLIGLVAGCSGSKKMTTEAGNMKVSQPHFFAPDFSKALYKADMNIYGRELSGLMLFKKSKGSTQVAFVSEFGLKYFEIEVPANNTAPVTFHYLMDLMNRKPVVKMLKTSFRMLFLHYPENEKNYSFECHDGWMVSVLKDRGDKVNYSYQQNSGWVESARQYGWFKPKIKMEASGYGGQYSSTIRIWQGKKIEIDLALIGE